MDFGDVSCPARSRPSATTRPTRIRSTSPYVNATDPDRNAWARRQGSELDHAGFDAAFAAESTALGHQIPGADVLAALSGDVRPEWRPHSTP